MFKFKNKIKFKKGKTSGRSDDVEETIRNRIQNFNKISMPVLDFYRKYGKIYNVDTTKTVEEVHASIIPSLNSHLIFFYGPPSTGKTTIAKILCEQLNYFYLNLEEFFTFHNLHDDISKSNKLLEFFDNTSEKNFIIDSFFENKSQCSIFFKQFPLPRNIFYFDATKEQVFENIKKYENCQQKAKKEKYNTFLANRNDLVKIFKKMSERIVKINVNNNCIDNIQKQILDHLTPEVYYANYEENEELFNNSIFEIEKKLGKLFNFY